MITDENIPKDLESEESRSDKDGLLGVPTLLRQKFLNAFSLPQDFERKVEDGINRALTLLNIPTREEVRSLQSRLDQLISRCEALITAKQNGGDNHS